MTSSHVSRSYLCNCVACINFAPATGHCCPTVMCKLQNSTIRQKVSSDIIVASCSAAGINCGSVVGFYSLFHDVGQKIEGVSCFCRYNDIHNSTWRLTARLQSDCAVFINVQCLLWFTRFGRIGHCFLFAW